jgi:hypothetical protein
MILAYKICKLKMEILPEILADCYLHFYVDHWELMKAVERNGS